MMVKMRFLNFVCFLLLWAIAALVAVVYAVALAVAVAAAAAAAAAASARASASLVLVLVPRPGLLLLRPPCAEHSRAASN